MPIGMQSCYQHSPQNESTGSQKTRYLQPYFWNIMLIFAPNLFNMEEYLIISNANFLLRVASEQIAYVCSEGSYCNLRLTNGDEYTFSFNLVVFEKKIVEQLAQTAHFFARVGRNYIINSQHIFSINLNTLELVL